MFQDNSLTNIIIGSSDIEIGRHMLDWQTNHFRDTYKTHGVSIYEGSQEGSWVKVSEIKN